MEADEVYNVNLIMIENVELRRIMKYWKERCEAAETVIINETNDGYNPEDYQAWLNLRENKKN